MDVKRFVMAAAGNPVTVCGGIFLASSVSLAAALIAQYAYGLEPCILCLYQRAPYAITALLGAAGLAALYRPEGTKWALVVAALSAVAYFINGVIAAYHVGVEQHWWSSFLEGCAVDFDTADIGALKDMLESKPAVRCDQIPWADPILGISMAGYNVLLSFGLAAGCVLATITLRQRLQSGWKKKD